METVNLGEPDEGRVEIEFSGSKIKLDVFETCNYIYNLKKTTEGYSEGEENTSFIEDIRKYLISLGFSEALDQFLTLKFIKLISRIANELKKNIE